jgi:predicted porin
MGWQLGSNYWLSKRTNLYAIYGMQSTSNANLAAIPLGGTQPITNPSSYSASNYAVGVRHTF